MQALWEKVTIKLQNKLSTPGYKTFVSSARILSLEEGILTLAVPNDFTMNWVKQRCEQPLQEICKEELNQAIAINYIIKPDFHFDLDAEKEAALAPVSGPEVSAALANQKNVFNPKYTFETFVVGQSNRFAYAAALAVAQKPAAAYNPLFTYGGSGLGKTHLMHAIGQKAIELNPTIKILYVKSEDFVNEMIDAMAIQKGQEKINQFRQKYRTADVLLIDDIQFLMGKERSQEEFFHAFNALYEAKKQIVLNSDRPPRELQNLEDRLKSRFSWGLVTDVQPPDLETRIAILRKKINSEALSIPEDVLSYIATQIPSNVRDLEGAITRIIAHASLTGEQLSVDFASQTLKNLFSVAQEKHITISTIKQVVSEFYKIDIEELSAKVRTKEIAMARQIAMYLAKEMTPSSLTKIGSNFGGRDHTTVIHACDKVKDAIKNDPSYMDLITKLKKDILSR